MVIRCRFRRLVGWTGLAGVLLAPFGGFSFNLAAITAAICMSPDADPDPAQRYRASIWAGLFYIATGVRRNGGGLVQRPATSADSGDCRPGAIGHDWQRSGQRWSTRKERDAA